MNKVMLIGNVGVEPEVRYVDAGVAVATVRLATTERGYRLQNGTEVPDRTEWHNVVGWGKLADLIEQLGVHKGMSLFIEGSISYRSWDDPNGQKRYMTDITMETFQLLTPRPAQNNSYGNSSYNNSSYNQPNAYSNQATSGYGRPPQQNYQPAPMNDGPDEVEDDFPF